MIDQLSNKYLPNRFMNYLYLVKRGQGWVGGHQNLGSGDQVMNPEFVQAEH